MSSDTLQKEIDQTSEMHGEHIQSDIVDASDVQSEEAKREELRQRIAAGEKRNEERTFTDYAKQAADGATSFVKEHPVATVAGAVAVGLAIGAMTRPGRRVVRRGSVLATLAGEAALAYAAGLLDDAGDLAIAGKDKAEDLSDRLGTSAREASRTARSRAANLADEAGLIGRTAGRKASRSWRDLKRSTKR